MRHLGIGLMLIASCVLLWGCGEQNYGGEVQVSPQQSQQALEEQIKKIEADTHMPPQAKAAAIGNLKSRQKNAALMGKGMNGSASR